MPVLRSDCSVGVFFERLQAESAANASMTYIFAIQDAGRDQLGSTELVGSAERITAHLKASADHVCLQALSADPTGAPLDQWRRLAPLAAGGPGAGRPR